MGYRLGRELSSSTHHIQCIKMRAERASTYVFIMGGQGCLRVGNPNINTSCTTFDESMRKTNKFQIKRNLSTTTPPSYQAMQSTTT